MKYRPTLDLSTIPWPVKETIAKEVLAQWGKKHGAKGGRKIKNDPATEEQRRLNRERVRKFRERQKKENEK